MSFAGFIDPPSPFASLEEWEAFLESIAALDGPIAEGARREARQVISEKKAERQPGAS